MFNKIWSIRLNDYECSESKAKSYLSVNKFNLFIGVNNSGKSRLLRTLFISNKNELEYQSTEISKSIKESILPTMIAFSQEQHNPSQMVSSIAPTQMSDLLSDKPLSQTERNSLIEKYNSSFSSIYTKNPHLAGIKENLRNQLINEARSESYKPLSKYINGVDFFYIPILRGMRPFDKSKDSYLERTVNDYFIGTPLDPNFNPNIDDRDNEITVVTGLHLYELFKSHLLGKPEQRKAIVEYQNLLSKEFFEGKTITLIPFHENNNDTVHIQIGDATQFPIFNVGDGLQQIIIITSAAYLEKEPSIFFIEEPEQSLHAGLLRQLATFLIEHTNHQYFITTHSNHLLDLIDHRDQITIHRVSTVSDNDKIQITEYSDTDRTLLEELGVRPSSVYLANSTIWVEGITDRLYLRFFMKSYVDKITDETRKAKLGGFLENYHYALVEYQGGGIAHWNFDDDDVENDAVDGLCAIRASASAFLICDGDTKGKPRTLRLQEQLGERIHILPYKEMENILPHNVIVSTAELLFDSMQEKTKSGLFFDAVKRKKLPYFSSSKGIGKLLDSALQVTGKRRVFAEESGTIKNKVKFCNTAIKYMMENPDAWQITPELDDLCTKIFEHIENKN